MELNHLAFSLTWRNPTVNCGRASICNERQNWARVRRIWSNTDERGLEKWSMRSEATWDKKNRVKNKVKTEWQHPGEAHGTEEAPLWGTFHLLILWKIKDKDLIESGVSSPLGSLGVLAVFKISRDKTVFFLSFVVVQHKFYLTSTNFFLLQNYVVERQFPPRCVTESDVERHVQFI